MKFKLHIYVVFFVAVAVLLASNVGSGVGWQVVGNSVSFAGSGTLFAGDVARTTTTYLKFTTSGGGTWVGQEGTAGGQLMPGGTYPNASVLFGGAGLVLGAGTTSRVVIDATSGITSTLYGFGTVGVKPTITGTCAPLSGQGGGAAAGSFTLNGAGPCTAILTFPAAPTGWFCQGYSAVNQAVIPITASSTTSCTFSVPAGQLSSYPQIWFAFAY